MIHPNNVRPLGWGRVAGYGAELGIACAFLYALAFIGYAIVRATLDLLVTPQIETGWLGTAIATWVSLAVPALLLAALFAPLAALIGSLTALVVNAVSMALNPGRAQRQAIAIGTVVCTAVVVVICGLLFFGMGLTWKAAIAETLIFWLVLPLSLYIIAGGVGSWSSSQLKLEDGDSK